MIKKHNCIKFLFMPDFFILLKKEVFVSIIVILFLVFKLFFYFFKYVFVV